MANHTATNGRAAKLLAQGATAEQRLLRRERKAEKAVRNARAKASIAQAKLDRRIADLIDAEAKLRDRQALRAAGPNGASGEETSQPQPDAETTAPRAPTTAADSPIVLPGQLDAGASGGDAALIVPSLPARPPRPPRRHARRTSGASQ